MSNAPVVGQRCTAFACSSGPRSHCRQPCSWRTTSSILPDLSFRQGQVKWMPKSETLDPIDGRDSFFRVIRTDFYLEPRNYIEAEEQPDRLVPGISAVWMTDQRAIDS